MSTQIVPNTDTGLIAAYAIAWDIVRLSDYGNHYAGKYETPEQINERLTNAFVDTLKAVFNQRHFASETPTTE